MERCGTDGKNIMYEKNRPLGLSQNWEVFKVLGRIWWEISLPIG